MPTVPRYNEPQVRQGAIQGPRTPAVAPLEAFGGGESTQQVFQAAQGLNKLGTDIANQEYENQYKSAVDQQARDVFTQLSQQETALKVRLSQAKGKDAIPESQKILEDYDKSFQETRKGITNRDVAGAVDQRYAQGRQSLNSWATPYAAQEMFRYDNEGTLAGIKSLQEGATVDTTDAYLASSVAEQRRLREEFGRRNGLHSDVIAGQQAEDTSNTYASAIKAMIAKGDDLGAKRIYDQITGGGSFTVVGQDVPGMVEQGNIDLGNRPQVKNADGSISTVKSIGVEIDGKEVLLPTISSDGKSLTTDEAIAEYKRTGKHLGKFSDPASADKYAQSLHEQQAKSLWKKSLLIGNDATQIAAKVMHGSKLGEATRRVDDIFAMKSTREVQLGEEFDNAVATITRTGPENLGSALSEARKIEDPATRRMTEDMIRQRWADKENAEADTQKADFNRMSQILETSKGDLQAVMRDPAWLEATDGQRKALRETAGQLTRREKPVTDQGLWYSYVRMASHPATRGEFIKSDLRAAKSRLSDEDFQELSKMQYGLANSDAKALAKANRNRTDLGIINGVTDKMKDKDKETFTRVVFDKINALEAAGKVLTDEDTQKIVDSELEEVTLNKRWYWSNDVAPRYQIEAEAKSKAEKDEAEAEKRSVDVVRQMDEVEIEKIILDLKRRNQQVTSRRILELYNAKQRDQNAPR